MESNIFIPFLFGNLLVAIIFLLKKNCEIPFFLAFFNLMVEYRFWAIKRGYTNWVDFDYGISFIFNSQQGVEVSNLITLGSSILIYSFIFFYRDKPSISNDKNLLLQTFILQQKRTIIFGLTIFTIFQIYVSGSISMGYGILAKLGNSSFIILIFLVSNFTKTKSPLSKIFYSIVFLSFGWLTYSTSLRFQFLGWMIPIGYYYTRNVKPSQKIIGFTFALFILMIIFSSAGVLRNNNLKNLTWPEFYQKSIDRLLVAEDVNFIDGFIMMHQIYPKVLNYTYGLEHLEILLRPIPRTLWPNKPLAGWVQNYILKYQTKTVNVGFSPTLYGVFYAEAGIAGIIIFGVIWGKCLSYLYSYFKSFKSNLSALLVGILLSSMIPIFRSGDLAGDFAIVVMSYWPIILFVKKYIKFLEKELIKEND